MISPLRHNRGVALFMVVGSVLMALIVTSIVLNLMLSQSRLTHHRVSRILAYYAAQAGTNLAIEMLRNGTWPTPALGNTADYNICRVAGCSGGGNEVVDADVPVAVLRVSIEISNRDVDTGPRDTLRIRSQATYTFT